MSAPVTGLYTITPTSYNKQKYTLVFMWKDSEPSLKLLTVTLMHKDKNQWTHCRVKPRSCVCVSTALCVCARGRQSYSAPYLSFYRHALTFTPFRKVTSIIIYKFHCWWCFTEASVDTRRNSIFIAACDRVQRCKSRLWRAVRAGALR